MQYHRAIKHGAHLFSHLKAMRLLTEGTMESDIMDTYAQLVAHRWEVQRAIVIRDILTYHKEKGLP